MTYTRIVIVALTLCQSMTCVAQHAGDIFTQVVAGRLDTGSAAVDDGEVSMGARVYSGVFNSIFAVDDPGWNSLGAGAPRMPPGAEALDPNANLQWDFLPMKIDGTVANLFYWDGTGAVEFGSLPGAGYEFGLEGKSGFELIYGTPDLVLGGVVDGTDSLGGIHVHRFWYLDDGDGSLATDPVNGVYLASLRTRMDALDRSAPFYVLFRTLTTPAAALTSAAAWTDTKVDELSPDFAADFDGDLDVDGSDFLTWQRGFGTMGSGALQLEGDANFDNAVNAADLAVWESEYGSSLATFAGASGMLGPITQIPEPSGLLLLLMALASHKRLWYFWQN